VSERERDIYNIKYIYIWPWNDVEIVGDVVWNVEMLREVMVVVEVGEKVHSLEVEEEVDCMGRDLDGRP